MEETKVKILHLVLYNQTPQYQQMHEQTKPWYQECARRLGVDTYYYFYDPFVSVPTIDTSAMMLRLPGVETYYPGILFKTLEALEYFSKDGYSFVVRSNISTPVNFFNLLEHIPRSALMLYGGPHLINPSLVETQRDNVLFEKVGAMKFAHGTCIVFGPDTVRFLLGHRSDICTSIEDDFGIGVLCKQHDITPINIGDQHASFDEYLNINVATTFRNHDVGSDRTRDIDAIAHQVTALNNSYVFLSTQQQVARAWYHTTDITSLLHKLCVPLKKWTTDQNNSILDVLFGDPCPNMPKILTIQFQHDKRMFVQRCTLTFELKEDDRLWVQTACFSPSSSVTSSI